MKKKKDILITKASGDKVPFIEEKLSRSLSRAGADEMQIQEIIKEVSGQLYEGISTKKLYHLAFSKLKEKSKHLAARYHLKHGIMELGPSGYAFEKYIGEILKYQGYAVEVGVIVKGKCVNHEIDVIALTNHHHFMIECKYHNQRGIICDVKIPLYINSRFKDVETEWIKLPGHDKLIHQGWVVTNTKFSTDAIQYANCSGLKLLGWDYPAKGSLRDIIDDLGLYPVTCLTTLSKAEKIKLLNSKIVLCTEICHNPQLLYDLGMNEAKVKRVLNEGQMLCRNLLKHDNT